MNDLPGNAQRRLLTSGNIGEALAPQVSLLSRQESSLHGFDSLFH